MSSSGLWREGAAWTWSSSSPVIIPASCIRARLPARPLNVLLQLTRAKEKKSRGQASAVKRGEREREGGVETLWSDKAGGGRRWEGVGLRFTLRLEANKGATAWRK